MATTEVTAGIEAAAETAVPILRREGRSLVWFAAVAGVAAAVLALLQLAAGERPHALDDAVLLGLRNRADLYDPVGPDWLLYFARDATALAGWPVLTIFTLVLGGWLALRRHWATVVVLLAAVVGHSVLVSLIKDLVSRDRPAVVPHLAIVSDFSFPSGHSASAAAVYLTLAAIVARSEPKNRALRLYAMTVAIVLTLTIGLSRLYLGVHYPTDVLAGTALGAAWASLVWLAAYYVEKRRERRTRTG